MVLSLSVLYLSLHYIVRSLLALTTALRTRSAEPPGDSEPADVVAGSRFSIPVSVVIVVDADEQSARRTIESALKFHYPTFEIVVVVNDSAWTLPVGWREAYQLQPCEVFFRRQLVTRPVRRIYRAGGGTRLLVVTKVPGGLGDALNCAVNFCRYRYVCSVASGVACRADALIRLMRPIAEAPAANVGAIAAVSGSADRQPEGSGGAPRSRRLRDRLAAVADLVSRRGLQRDGGPRPTPTRVGGDGRMAP